MLSIKIKTQMSKIISDITFKNLIVTSVISRRFKKYTLGFTNQGHNKGRKRRDFFWYFLQIGKSDLDLGKKSALIEIICGLNFSFKMLLLEFQEEKLQVFPAWLFVNVLQMKCLQTALIPRNLPYPVKVLVVPLVMMRRIHKAFVKVVSLFV